MDLNYDYGDVIHTHKHIHTKPDSHKQVVEHSLREWCHDYFGDTGAPECSELNEISDHDIDDGSHDNLKASDLFKMIKDFEKLDGTYKEKERGNEHDIKFIGTELKVEEELLDIEIKKEGEHFKIEVGDYEIKEDGIYIKDSNNNIYIKLTKTEGEYDGSVVKKFKQFLRNIDNKKMLSEINTSTDKLDIEKKELKKRLHQKKNKFGAERKLEQMEILVEERVNELLILIGLFFIAAMFGIYCIYTQFNLYSI